MLKRKQIYGLMSRVPKSNVSFDIVIVAHSKDKNTLVLLLESIKKYVTGYQNIYLIAKENFIGHDFIFVPETSFPFKKVDIIATLSQLGCPEYKYGWYYQQLLKLYTYKVISNLSEYFLILDADLIFVNKIVFFDNDKPYLTIGYGHNQHYFDHMTRLFPGLTKQSDFSGISHNMMFKKDALGELFVIVEKIHGMAFWKAFLNTIRFVDGAVCCASEYEIYFNYVLKYYPDLYLLRELKWEDGYSNDDIKRKRMGHTFVCRHDYNINDCKKYVIE